MSNARGSKLPEVGTTIFTVMSQRARELGALNLGQGFPDYEIDPRLAELVASAMRSGHNQYAPMEGTELLRQRIAQKLEQSYGLRTDPLGTITVTLGATEALFSAIAAFVGSGEEAILFDPAYDSYAPAVKLAGGRALRIPLSAPHFRYDWDRVRDALTPRTRLIVINTPHNPSCTAASAEDIEALAALTRDRPIVIIGDEVYEHVLFDGRRHLSLCAHPELAERSISIFSFGKMLHATGLRVGYCIAPAALTREVRKVHQFNTFSIAHPLQHAIGEYLGEKPQAWRELSAFFQAKRDRLCTGLSGSPFVLRPAEGTYFQLLDYAALSHEPDTHFAERLLNAAGVATIPLSPFYEHGSPSTLLRLCIAKRDATLDAACERLRHFAHEA